MKGHWEITVPGYWKTVQQVCTPHGLDPQSPHVWVDDVRVWVGPKPLAYKIGWFIVLASLGLMFYAMLISPSLYIEQAAMFAIPSLVSLLVGFLVIGASRPYDK